MRRLKHSRPGSLARSTVLCALGALVSLACAPSAHAWGNEGHEVIALIAAHYLTPAVRARVDAMLAHDDSGLTPDTSMAEEATWADQYREAGGRRTERWHFVNLEIDHPDLAKACGGPSRLANPAYEGPVTRVPASRGPARDCVVDKIEQFEAELTDSRTGEAERLRALQFLLHLVGDVHQPLHAADAHDEGGNRRHVRAPGERAGTLHHYWDTVFVRDLGADPHDLAHRLIARIRPADLVRWRAGGPVDWARESFAIAAADAYGSLPTPGARGRYVLSRRYVRQADAAVALQLSRAGVRLAMLLNRALR